MSKKIAFSAAAIALAYVTSFIRLFTLPFGGSVTLFSMLFVVLIGYWLGPKYGFAGAIVYSLLQFAQDPYILSPLQVCCDYLFAFASLGISGLFARKQPADLRIVYLVCVFVRGFWNTLGGYLFWSSYMPENFPKSIAALYPVIYNYGFLLAEAVLTIVLLSLPAMKKGLGHVRSLLET